MSRSGGRQSLSRTSSRRRSSGRPTSSRDSEESTETEAQEARSVKLPDLHLDRTSALTTHPSVTFSLSRSPESPPPPLLSLRPHASRLARPLAVARSRPTTRTTVRSRSHDSHDFFIQERTVLQRGERKKRRARPKPSRPAGDNRRRNKLRDHTAPSRSLLGSYDPHVKVSRTKVSKRWSLVPSKRFGKGVQRPRTDQTGRTLASPTRSDTADPLSSGRTGSAYHRADATHTSRSAWAVVEPCPGTHRSLDSETLAIGRYRSA